jgi:hypothetical protein
MNRPSLSADPVMGLTGDRGYAIALLAHHRHVYFSDLRGISTAGMTLSGRLFYGCIVAPETFSSTALTDTRFVCCAGAGDLPAHAEARHAIEEVERGNWERVWALLAEPSQLPREAIEHLLAVAALGMLDARMETRLSSMTRVARFLRAHPGVVPTDASEVLQAFLLYGAADASDMVWYDAVALVDELRMPMHVLEHLVGRARSLDPRERVEALVGRQRMRLGVYDVEPPPPPFGELLDDDSPDVQLALLHYLQQAGIDASDADLIPDIDLAEKLNPMLRSADERVRREAARYARKVGGSINRAALLDLLRDPDEPLRNLAFEALYQRLPQDELRQFLLNHEASPAQRAFALSHETRWRARGGSFIAEPDELRAMLASDDPQQRREALRLAGYVGDPAFIPDVDAARRDPDPRVQAEAERLLQQLNTAPRETL